MTPIADRYEPLGNAHWGGMGFVNECIDRHLNRSVMLKTVHRPADMPRLMDERKALLKLRSKHVAQLLDVVSFQHNYETITCLVIEKIDGTELPTNFVPDLVYQKALWQIASGLADIHEARVIHRDIKPGNVRVDGNGLLKIIDFGLAREVGVDDSTNSIAGTMGYMAPELFGDRTISFSPAVDVFAFGQTARAMLGYIPPNGPLAPLVGGAIAAQFPNMSTGISSIIEASLNPAPAKRPPVAEIARELARGLLKDRHRARIIDGRGKPYELHSGHRVATIHSGGNSITIRYDGFRFAITALSGDVYINNRVVSVGDEMTASCVITLGSGNGGGRTFLTFDVSNPEVVA